ncbi:MAG: hypothetical protein HND53_10200 [Proteobacteria bacterium]|nr:hypothetical protein [Pseudomonadota bacterium]NOG60861.1 hypothetical protein [Pseudomonadota bacterium]
MLNKTINTVLISLIATLLVCKTASAEIIEVNFAYVGDKEHSALLGVKQGLEEANLQGQFLNQKYNLDLFATKDALTHDFSDYIAVLTAVDIDNFQILAKSLSNTPVFNLSISDDSIRAACADNTLHIIPSNRMAEDALSQWQKKEADSNAKAQAWHADFVKFAARDLNKRFKKNHKVKMDDYSWSGWSAVKMTTDTVARTQITNPEKMLNYLKSELSFDGQKGSNMNFRETGQLRQLLLLIEDNKIVAEAPVRGIAKPPTLDSLGIINCKK